MAMFENACYLSNEVLGTTQAVSIPISSGFAAATNRMLRILVVSDNRSDDSSKTFNGASVVNQIEKQSGGTSSVTAVYYLTIKDADIPTSAGSYNLSFTFGGNSNGIYVLVTYWDGQNQSATEQWNLAHADNTATQTVALDALADGAELCLLWMRPENKTTNSEPTGAQSTIVNVADQENVTGAMDGVRCHILNAPTPHVSTTYTWSLSASAHYGAVVFQPQAVAGAGWQPPRLELGRQFQTLVSM